MLRVRLPCGGQGLTSGLKQRPLTWPALAVCSWRRTWLPEAWAASWGLARWLLWPQVRLQARRVRRAGPRDPPQALPPLRRRDAHSVFGKQGPWGTSCIRPLPAESPRLRANGPTGRPHRRAGHRGKPVAGPSPRPASTGKVRGTGLWEGLRLGAPGPTERPVPLGARRPQGLSCKVRAGGASAWELLDL